MDQPIQRGGIFENNMSQTSEERLETKTATPTFKTLENEHLKPFSSDGCSGFMSYAWRRLFRNEPPWEGCCFAHDVAYWKGGPTKLRLEADIELMRGVALNGHPYWAMLMFLAVRIGGPWWLPYPSIRRRQGKWHFSCNEVRWGYGYRYPRYKE